MSVTGKASALHLALCQGPLACLSTSPSTEHSPAPALCETIGIGLASRYRARTLGLGPGNGRAGHRLENALEVTLLPGQEDETAVKCSCRLADTSCVRPPQGATLGSAQACSRLSTSMVPSWRFCPLQSGAFRAGHWVDKRRHGRSKELPLWGLSKRLKRDLSLDCPWEARPGSTNH